MSKSLEVTSGFAKSFRRRATCQCASLLFTRTFLPKSARNLTTSSARPDEEERYGNRGRDLRTGPRWQSTPPSMMAPVRSKPPVANNDFAVNEVPERLDKVYDRVLGKGGCNMLTDEVKWLAVTHKSFDHGRRGFNDRLNFLGKRIVELQTSLNLFHSSSAIPFPETKDKYGREPFRHPALDGLAGVSLETRHQILNMDRLAQLGEKYELDTVIRWKPKRATNLKGSGLPSITVQALYAIVGAVALQKGGKVANDIARERILLPLGLR